MGKIGYIIFSVTLIVILIGLFAGSTKSIDMYIYNNGDSYSCPTVDVAISEAALTS